MKERKKTSSKIFFKIKPHTRGLLRDWSDLQSDDITTI